MKSIYCQTIYFHSAVLGLKMVAIFVSNTRPLHNANTAAGDIIAMPEFTPRTHASGCYSWGGLVMVLG